MSYQEQPLPWPPPSEQSLTWYQPRQYRPQYQQPYFQQLVYYPPPQPMTPYKPKNKTMAIVTFSIGLLLVSFSAVPTTGIVFSFLGFFCNVLGLVFLYCI